MPIYNVVSNGTLTLYDRVFDNFADGDVSTITFPNDLFALQTGKNANTIFTRNETGRNATLVLRLIRGSSDDQFMQSKIADQKKDFAAVQLAFGEFVLRLGDGEGNVVNDTYTLKAGVIMREVDTKENVSGDVAQGVSVYTVTFANVDRSIQ